MARLGTVSWGRFATNDACHFWVPLLDHGEGIYPACQVRSSATPRRTGQLQTRVGVVTGRKLLDQLWANGPQPKISTWGCAEEKDQPRALEVFHCRDSLEKEFMFSRLPGQKLLHKIRMADGNTQNFEPLGTCGQCVVPSPHNCVGVQHPR